MHRAVVPLALTALALAACRGPSAPEDSGVCFRVDDAAGKSSFVALARGVENLETCAVLLEGVNLQGHPAPVGAYQGYYIFIGSDGIRSARSLHGMRYPIFQPPQRASIDKDLKRMMKERGGQLPDASDLSIERK
jgi:hypothetical protein